MTVSSSSHVLSHGWITRTDLGLYHTPGSSARQVPRSSPAMAAHKPASQRQHTGEETFSPSGWMKPYDDGERGIWSYPTTQTHSTPQSRCKTEKFSLPYHNYSSQKYSLQLAPAHRTPHLSDAEPSMAPFMFLSFLPKTSGRSTPITPKPWEKGLQDSHRQIGEVMSVPSLQISWGGSS